MTFRFILRFQRLELGFHFFHHSPDAITFVKIFLFISLIAFGFQLGKGGLEFMNLGIIRFELGVRIVDL